MVTFLLQCIPMISALEEPIPAGSCPGTEVIEV